VTDPVVLIYKVSISRCQTQHILEIENLQTATCFSF